MRFVILLFLTISLCGCVNEPNATETIADSAKEQVSAIYNGLPNNCKTDVNKKQTEAAQKAIDAIVQSCNDQKEIIEQEKVKWKFAFFGLLAAIVVFIIKKVLK